MPVSKSRRRKKSAPGGGKVRLPMADQRALRTALAELMQADQVEEPDDDLSRAQSLIYDAWEAETPAQAVALAAKALEISPLCADAYVLMAQYAGRLSDERIDLLRRGVEAGRAALGDGAFDDDVGHFWGILETRPYMRARAGLAMALWERGDRVEPLEHLRELLRLNPNDNQGLRYVLAAYLLELGRDDELGAILDAYKEDASAAVVWTTAVASFRRRGDSPESRRLLEAALAQNTSIAPYLLGERRLPGDAPPFITFGGEDEAIDYARDFAPGWAQTPGALEWLRSVRESSRARRPRKRH
jgi:tetratricopeptide (TPR) repeat protein